MNSKAIVRYDYIGHALHLDWEQLFDEALTAAEGTGNILVRQMPPGPDSDIDIRVRVIRSDEAMDQRVIDNYNADVTLQTAGRMDVLAISTFGADATRAARELHDALIISPVGRLWIEGAVTLDDLRELIFRWITLAAARCSRIRGTQWTDGETVLQRELPTTERESKATPRQLLWSQLA